MRTGTGPVVTVQQLRRLWWSLPYDGQGLMPSAGAPLDDLRRRAAAALWKRAPWWSRPLVIPLARITWGVAAIGHVRRFARSAALSRRSLRDLLMDCLRGGARPNEALIWRQFFPAQGRHPLPGRAAAACLSRLGSAAEHRLLSDKQATADLLTRAGLSTPPLLEMIPRSRAIDLSSPAWLTPGELFIKPRHGSAGRGTMAIDVLGSGLYRLGDDTPITEKRLRETLAATATDDRLVQARLRTGPELADLATAGSAPVLRLTTAREPGEPPFLHSALLSIDVPGEWSRHFIRGQIRVPIDPVTARMAAGIWFLHPDERYRRLPWNDAAVEGRRLAGFHRAVSMVMQAMALLPGLPLVNWDLILTSDGPVILEGNTCGDWILTNLSTVQGIVTVPLIPLLRRWAGEASVRC